MSRARLIACVLLPFAAGYYLSYLFRTINALIAGDLTAELDLSAADLGFLTSVYFLVFAAVQLPLGALLDRYGPRTIQSCAAAAGKRRRARVRLGRWSARLADRPRIAGTRRRLGADGRLQGHRAVVSAGAHCARQRLAGDAGRARCCHGHGTGRARCAGDRLARPVRCAGWLVGAGGAAGSVRGARAEPAPEPRRPLCRASASGRSTGIDASGALRRSPPSASARPGRCRACGPHPGCATSTACDRAAVVQHLSVMAIAVCASALLLGMAADRLRRRGVKTELVLASTLVLSMAAQAALVLRMADAVLPALGGDRCGRRRDGSELRDPERVLSEGNVRARQRGPQPAARRWRLRPAVGNRPHHRAVARHERHLSGRSASDGHGREYRRAAGRARLVRAGGAKPTGVGDAGLGHACGHRPPATVAVGLDPLRHWPLERAEPNWPSGHGMAFCGHCIGRTLRGAGNGAGVNDRSCKSCCPYRRGGSADRQCRQLNPARRRGGNDCRGCHPFRVGAAAGSSSPTNRAP